MKRILALSAILVMSVSLFTGCGDKAEKDPLLDWSKQDLVNRIHALETDCDNLTAEVASLNDKIVGVFGEDNKKAAITQFETDDSGRFTLNSNDGVVTFPVGLEYPNSVQTYNMSSINITENVTIKPSSNWEVILDGTSIKLYHHSSGISGVLQVSSHDLRQPDVFVTDLQESMSKFFSELPPDTVTYSKIYLGSNWLGVDAQSHTYIDEQDARLRCGLVSNNAVNLAYTFSYTGEQDASKDELILNILQTISMHGVDLRVE